MHTLQYIVFSKAFIHILKGCVTNYTYEPLPWLKWEQKLHMTDNSTIFKLSVVQHMEIASPMMVEIGKYLTQTD